MSATVSQSDIQSPFKLSADQIAYFREMGFIQLKDVFTREALAHYGSHITKLILDLDPRRGQPLSQRDTYGKAFIQVGNLWLKSHVIKEFVFSPRLARIAAELLEVDGVRLYHDQALYKEAGGGITPWHADQFYWPMASDRCVTAWIPLQATPLEMGPVAFAAKSQHFTYGRDMGISDESEKAMARSLADGGFEVVHQPFDLGDVSFHLGWTYHRAGQNTTTTPRKVMTVIYMDADMRLAEATNGSKEGDRKAFCLDAEIGGVIDSPLTPVLWSNHEPSISR